MMPGNHDFWGRLDDRLGAEVDAASVGWLRLVCGLSVIWQITLSWWGGEIRDRFIDPAFFFKYPFFPFIPTMPGYVPYGIFTICACLGIAFLLGWQTRWTSKLLALFWTFLFLTDASLYSDQQYLLVLMLMLLAWIPVNRWFSSDRLVGREKRGTVPYWCVWLLRFQISLVLLASGLNKLNPDWLRGAPIAEWLMVEGGAWGSFDWLRQSHQLPIAIAWGTALFEIGSGLLLWRRRGAICCVPLLMVYSLADYLWFEMGVSPLIGLLSVVFLPPSFPRKLFDSLTPFVMRIPFGKFLWRMICRVGRLVDHVIGWFDETPVVGKKVVVPVYSTESEPGGRATWKVSEWTKYGMILWVLFQIVIPLRWVGYSQAKEWSEYTSRFSWRGQCQDKQGRLTLSMTLVKLGLKWSINPTDDFPIPLSSLYSQEELQKRGLNEGMLQDIARTTPDTLAGRIEGLNFSDEELNRLEFAQEVFLGLQLSAGHMEIMSRYPEFVRQYARQLARVVGGVTGDQVQVHALVEESVNSRPFQICLPETVELSAIGSAADLWPALLPMKDPLPKYEIRMAGARAVREQRELEKEMELRTMGLTRPPEPLRAPAISEDAEMQLNAEFAKLLDGSDRPPNSEKLQ